MAEQTATSDGDYDFAVSGTGEHLVEVWGDFGDHVGAKVSLQFGAGLGEFSKAEGDSLVFFDSGGYIVRTSKGNIRAKVSGTNNANITIAVNSL